MSRNNMPSMRPAAAVEPTPVHMLPVDVLVYIIDYAPLHGRLCAISLVCKRWRLAAMRSITSIRARTPGLSRVSLFTASNLVSIAHVSILWEL